MYLLAFLLVHSARDPHCVQSTGLSASLASPLRVLFVGNSYTYENNLPFVFEALADPVRDVSVTMVAGGGAFGRVRRG